MDLTHTDVPQNSIRTCLKHRLSINASLYQASKWAEMRLRYALGIPHEDEFRAFAALPAEGLFADIGANAGQSVLSFDVVRPGWRILSFEANPALEGHLTRTSRLLGGRHSFRIMGLAQESGELPFYVPVRDGIRLTQEGTFHRATLEQPATRERLGEHWTLQTIPVRVSRFDDLGLRPDVVKLDVQGSERQVLEGMRRTLAQHPPRMFYVERGPCMDETVRPLLDFGYRACFWDGKRLREWIGQECSNVIYLRP